jgi:asparagine synthase (glutamine-hydrolysing)
LIHSRWRNTGNPDPLHHGRACDRAPEPVARYDKEMRRMCGISGIINKNAAVVSPGAIRAINDLIAHRGPDGEGFFFDGHFALGHRRLAILDLSPDGHQPMPYLDKYVITFNGEIYNYLEIREQLERDGYRFASKTDTEVILAAYDKWGQACVERFNGMWGFCLYDKEKNILFCSRDRFGVKPFYYADTPQKFIFGSEIKQILCGRGGSPVANMRAVRDFLIEGYSDHTHDTFFEGVHALAAGHNLVYSLTTHTFRQTRYYTLAAQADIAALDEASATARFLAELKRSVAYRLRSDVKVGTCLSGGLDSSCIASLSSTLYHAASADRFQAIHAHSGVDKIDESGYARELAGSCGIDLRVIEPSADEFMRAIDEVVYCQEEPFAAPSIFMQYFVFQKAKEIGCKVMLDGQGGDETLLGYERYYSAYLRSIPWRAALRELFCIRDNSKLSLGQVLGHFLYFSVSNIRIWRLRRKFAYIKPEYLLHFPNIRKLSKGHRDIRDMQKMEIESFQLPHLLRYEDRNSMRHSIEARLPFLDYQVVEAAFGMNNHFKIKNGWTKHVLRVAMAGLVPEKVLWRKNKLGFEAPEAAWIKAASTAMKAAIGQSAILATMCKDKPDFANIDNVTFWKLYSIAKWEAVYAVQPAATGGEVHAARPAPGAAHVRRTSAAPAAAQIVNEPFE